MAKMGKKLMGIDFGERRIGIALSDLSQSISSPYTTIDTRENPDPFLAIGRILENEAVEGFVVGYPLRTDGKPSEKVEAVETFISELESRFPIPVIREDERFSSSRAEDYLRGLKRGKKKGNRKAMVDRIAASIILQDYLNRKGEVL